MGQAPGGTDLCGCSIFFLVDSVHREEALSRGAEGMSGLFLSCLPQKPWVGIEGPAFFRACWGQALSVTVFLICKMKTCFSSAGWPSMEQHLCDESPE